MQALRLPASRGLAWIIDGYRLFIKSPPVLVLLIFAFMFILLASNSLPVIGPLAVTVLTPTFLVGLMAACRALEQGQAAEMRNLFAGFRSNFQALLRLGLVFLVVAVAILAITALVDGGTLMQLKFLGPGSAGEIVVDDRFILALNLASIMFFPVVVIFFFASMLAAWHGVPALKGLFFSCLAGLRNVRAFLLYAFLLVALTSLLPALVLALAVALFDTSGAILALVVLMPVSLIMFAILLASIYASYRDIFRDDAVDVAAAPAAP